MLSHSLSVCNISLQDTVTKDRHISKDVFWISCWQGSKRWCLADLAPVLPRNLPTNRPWISQPNLSFISRAGHANMMSLLYNTGLFCSLSLSLSPALCLRNPQEMAPLSLGEEVACSRPLAHWIYGDCGKLLIITYTWKTRECCSAGWPLWSILEQWTVGLQLTRR